MRTDVLGVRFDNLTMDAAVDAARALMKERRAAYVVTPNPEIVLQCRELPALADAVADAALVLADGIGVIYAAKLLGRPLAAKVAGIDFATRLMATMAPEGGRVFLFGAKPGIASCAAQNLAQTHPGLKLVGTHDGYFSSDNAVIKQINAAKPDLLLVCLGAPKQELWMQRRAPLLDVGLMAGLGGSLDVFAGVSRRAPARMQNLGLEWLYRLAREPRRIGRMAKLPGFLALALLQRGKKDAS